MNNRTLNMKSIGSFKNLNNINTYINMRNHENNSIMRRDLNNYDNIKKSQCKLDILTILNYYINGGWSKLVKLFLNGNKNIKKQEFLNLKYIDVDTLKLLGHIRGYVVNKIFKCQKNKYDNDDTLLYFSGSSDITSDYDGNLMGKNSPNIMMGMFKDFLEKYNNTLPYSFDTNLYTCGFFFRKDFENSTNKGIKEDNKIYYKKKLELYDDIKELELVTFQPSNKDIELINFNVIFAKLKLLNILKSNKQRINEYNYINNLDKILDKYIGIEKENIKNKYNYNDETLLIYSKYMLQKKYIEMFYNDINYNDKLIKEITNYLDISIEKFTHLMLLCIVKYYSMESYYTHCTFNVVVLEDQTKVKLKNLTKINYVCSLIENLGDLNNNFEIYDDDIKNYKKLIKISKYMYRMIYSIDNINVKLNNMKINVIIKKFIKYRKRIEYVKYDKNDEILVRKLYKEFNPKNKFDFKNLKKEIISYFFNIISILSINDYK